MTWKGWERVTEADVKKLGRTPPALKGSKYGAKRTVVDGLTFDSKREAARYCLLVVRMKAGDIQRLRCQPRFDLCVKDKVLAEYVADFQYDERVGSSNGWQNVVEDVKGARTDIYKLKKRWFETQYGIEIRES